MSIATKTGDSGTTGLLFGARVSKTDFRIAAVGDIDELSAAIGLAKVLIKKFVMGRYHTDYLQTIQRSLTFFMGEVVTEPDKRESYAKKYDSVTEENLARLDKEIENLEKDPCTKQTDWIMYGNSEIGARLDLSSKVCRRAERSFAAAKESESSEAYRPLLSKYINRLSDYLHLLARYYDSVSNVATKAKLKYRYE